MQHDRENIMSEKIVEHERELKEIEGALRHIKKAANITTCSLCFRDLTIAETLLQNLTTVLAEVIEEEKKENREERV